MSDPGTYTFPAEFEGDTVPATMFAFTDPAGQPMSFAGASITLTFRDRLRKEARVATIGNGISVSGAVVTVEQFTAMRAGSYTWGMRFTFSSGSADTLMIGDFQSKEAP